MNGLAPPRLSVIVVSVGAGDPLPSVLGDLARRGAASGVEVIFAERYGNFVGGQWKPSRTGQTFENENPVARGSNLGLFQSSSPDDIDEAVAAADAAFRTWRGVAWSSAAGSGGLLRAFWSRIGSL